MPDQVTYRPTAEQRASERAEDKAGAASASSAAKLPFRATFAVTEINHTTRGVTVLTLAAQYDGAIKEDQRLLKGARPVGALTLEVQNDYAAKNVAHGSLFYLVSV